MTICLGNKFIQETRWFALHMAFKKKLSKFVSSTLLGIFCPEFHLKSQITIWNLGIQT